MPQASANMAVNTPDAASSDLSTPIDDNDFNDESIGK